MLAVTLLALADADRRHDIQMLMTGSEDSDVAAVAAAKLIDSSDERPAGGNVGSIYIDYGIRTNCSTTVATACVVVRNFEQPGALRTDIAADTDVNDRIAVDRTAADPVTVSVVYSEARVTARSGEIAAKIGK